MKIIIAGGGTAGWLAALFVSSIKNLDPKNITIIDSEKSQPIGVGESTTHLFTNVIKNQFGNFGCDMNKFISTTGATFKYSIKHKDFASKKGYYHGPIDGGVFTSFANNDLFEYFLRLENGESLKSISLFGHLLEKNLSPYDKNGSYFGFNEAMHIDAYKTAAYFKEICLKKGVVHKRETILNTTVSDTGFIQNLHTNQDSYSADLYIDCTGFQRLLIGSLNPEWKSYSDILPANTALNFNLQYTNDLKPYPYTTAQAMSAGWMWKIPLMTRLGCGYVFNRDFISPEHAKNEVEQHFNMPIDVRKVIEFEAGRLEKPWIKNCVAVGLSSGFIEPLEATSIHTTVCQLIWLCNDYINVEMSNNTLEAKSYFYNSRVRTIFDETKDFIFLHYLGNRQDSEFWRYMNNEVRSPEYIKQLIEICKQEIPPHSMFSNQFGSPGWPLYSHVLAGLNKFDMLAGSSDFFIEKTKQSIKEQFYSETENVMNYDSFIKNFRNQSLE